MKKITFLVLLSFTYTYSIEEFQDDLIGLIPSKNFVISPLSVYQIVSLAANGAKGSTQSQMVSALRGKNLIQLNQENQKINNILSHSNNLMISNAIFSMYHLKQTFVQIAINKYNSTVGQLNSVSQVNEWCANKTNNKITNIIDTIDNISLILLNALYFKDNWLTPFDAAFTRKEQFNKKQIVNMMHQTFDDALYYGDSKVQVLKLFYSNTRYSSLIILPNENFDINGIKMQGIKEWVCKLVPTKVKLALPKFTLDYDITLNEVMKKMGMVHAFDQGRADFTNMSEDVELYLSMIKHKAFLKVDEHGAEAAAVTVMTFDERCMMPDNTKPIEMKVNRPFIFTIEDNSIKNIGLFYAKITTVKE